MAVPLMSARRPAAFDDVFRMSVLARRYSCDPCAVARQFDSVLARIYLLRSAEREGERCPTAGGANMCEQDQFEKDRKEYEARGLVTRRQFGVLLGAGVVMMLPRVVNAVAGTDADVTVTTPDGTADCYFRHPASGPAPGVLLR